jgi:hypothetical protein
MIPGIGAPIMDIVGKKDPSGFAALGVAMTTPKRN